MCCMCNKHVNSQVKVSLGFIFLFLNETIIFLAPGVITMSGLNGFHYTLRTRGGSVAPPRGFTYLFSEELSSQ